MGIFDKPARADVLNMINSSGYKSCLKCLHSGKRIKTSKGGHKRVFVYQFNKPLKRNRKNYAQHALSAEKNNEVVRGIKGWSILCHLKYFNPTRNTCIDYMHSILLGVMKTFFKYWWETDSSKPYSLKKFMPSINEKLIRIRPPSFVSTPPRSIHVWQKWRAHEYLHFMIHYLVPVFNNAVPKIIFDNIIKLVIFMQIILNQKINRKYLKQAQVLIERFLNELVDIYDEAIMVSGTHELIHLIDCTLDFGPLNNINCFPYEEMNRKFLSCIKGIMFNFYKMYKKFNFVKAKT